MWKTNILSFIFVTITMLVCTVLSYQIIVPWIIQRKHHKIKSNCKQWNLFLLWGFLIFFFRHLQGNAASAHRGGTPSAPAMPRQPPASSPRAAAPLGLGSEGLRVRSSSRFCTEPADRSYSNHRLALGLRSLPALLPAAPSRPLARGAQTCAEGSPAALADTAQTSPCKGGSHKLPQLTWACCLDLREEKWWP